MLGVHCHLDINWFYTHSANLLAFLPSLYPSQPTLHSTKDTRSLALLVPTFTHKHKWWLSAISDSAAKIASHRSTAKYNICDCCMISFLDSRYIYVREQMVRCEPYKHKENLEAHHRGKYTGTVRRVWFIYVAITLLWSEFVNSYKAKLDAEVKNLIPIATSNYFASHHSEAVLLKSERSSSSFNTSFERKEIREQLFSKALLENYTGVQASSLVICIIIQII